MTRGAMAILALSILAGCSSIAGSALEGMREKDVDLVVNKVVARYNQLGRVAWNEPFVFVLDSVVVGGSLRDADDRSLVKRIVSYMLGESTGSQWATRTEEERALFGEGQVELLVTRGLDGERFFLDVLGSFGLFLPLSRVGGDGPGGVEALSYDVRAANQPLALASDSVRVACEILPRSAVYSAGGPVFKRWANALFQLELGGGDPAAREATAVRRTPQALEERVQGFLRNARAYVGPVIELDVHLDRGANGLVAFAHGRPNDVWLVLPASLLAGDRGAERALARLVASFPESVKRRGDDLLVRVGYFFFHGDATGAADQKASEAAEAAKRARVPPRPQ
jgi:hypothetical protein